MKNSVLVAFLNILLVLLFPSCKKYLDEKSDKSFSTPSSIKDLQLLLEDFDMVNSQYVGRAELLSDNYYVIATNYNSVSNVSEKKLHVWEKDANTEVSWTRVFRSIYQFNLVLDELENLKKKECCTTVEYNYTRGAALFFRSYYYYGLSQIFIPPYNSLNESLGLPLREHANINEVVSRSTIKMTYDFMIKGLLEAANLLPANSSIKTRPSKSAAYGALAKVFLSMSKFDSALKYSNLAINTYSGKLIDFNSEIVPSANVPMPLFMVNPEVVVYLYSPSSTLLSSTRGKIDSFLFKSYAENDIRKKAFFRINTDESYRFKGGIDGGGTSAAENNSVQLNELYLIRAEGYARAGLKVEALQDLNFLLSKRIESATFTPLETETANDALKLIITERRKELLFNGSRWTDLRRFKDDALFQVIPKRVIDGVTYELLPNSPRYTLQIPQIVVDLSGVQQNP